MFPPTFENNITFWSKKGVSILSENSEFLKKNVRENDIKQINWNILLSEI